MSIKGFRGMRVACLCMAIGAVASLPSRAVADFSNRVLQASFGGSVVSGFQGQQGFVVTNGIRTLDVTVDYAVFNPGQFPGSFAAFTGFSAPNPTDYIYAYQVYNNGPGNGLSDTAFSQLGIDSLGGLITSLGQDVNFDPSGTDIAPFGAFLSQQGASYQFLIPTIAINRFSTVLLLSSPQAPRLSQASVFDSGLSAHGFVPMPVPAPGAALLGVIGLGLLGAKRRG